VLTFASSSGTYGTINDPTGTTLTPTYNSGNLTLEVALLTPSDSSPEGQFREANPEQETLLAGLLGPRQQQPHGGGEAFWLAGWTDLLTLPVRLLEELVAVV